MSFLPVPIQCPLDLECPCLRRWHVCLQPAVPCPSPIPPPTVHLLTCYLSIKVQPNDHLLPGGPLDSTPSLPPAPRHCVGTPGLERSCFLLLRQHCEFAFSITLPRTNALKTKRVSRSPLPPWGLALSKCCPNRIELNKTHRHHWTAHTGSSSTICKNPVNKSEAAQGQRLALPPGHLGSLQLCGHQPRDWGKFLDDSAFLS